MHVFHLGRSESYLLYGAYAAFAFSTPVIGGVIADKILGSKNTMILGGILNIFGNLMLVSLDRYAFCVGLAVSLIGSGLYKSTSTNLVGTLYEDGDDRKESGFTWFYLAINLGGALGPLTYGLVVYLLGWNFGFLCSAIGILIGLLWFLSQQKLLGIDNTLERPRRHTLLLFCFILAGACLLLSVPFYYPHIMNFFVITMFLLCLAYLVRATGRYKNKEKSRLKALLLLGFLGMFYFAAGMQIGTTITLFIQHYISLGVIETHLPASTFSALYSLFVILLAPIVSLIWKSLKNRGIEFSAPIKLAMGTALATLGIAAFAYASVFGTILSGVIIGNLLLSAGELVLTPSIYTAMSNLSPIGMKSTMMGGWLLFVALGGYVSSLLADASHSIAPLLPLDKTPFFGEFLFISVFTLCIAILILVLTPKLKRMMA
jgi:POT family proton-dependent oligopeptide transporter